MAAKLTRLTHKIAIQLYLMTDNCTICSSRSRRPVRRLLDTPSYIPISHVAPYDIPVTVIIVLILLHKYGIWSPNLREAFGKSSEGEYLGLNEINN